MEVLQSRFEDLNGRYEITTAQEIFDALGDTIILDRYIQDLQWIHDKVIDVAVLCWGNEDENGNKLHKTNIKLKKSLEDKTVFTLPLNRLMISLCFICPVVEYFDQIDLSQFILHDFLSAKRRRIIQKNIVDVLQRNGHLIKEIQRRFSDLAYDLQNIMQIFSGAEAIIFTAENLFLDQYKVSPIIRDINNTKYPDNMQTHEIVESNKQKYEDLEKEMVRLGNPLFDCNKYTKIIKPKQMEEQYINFSQIPDGESIIPIIMNGNGFNAGYHEMDTLYAGAIAARVPDMMNKEYMGKAGYFNRNLMILTYGTLSKSVWDCGSMNPIPIIVDDVVLEMYAGSNYYREKNDGRLRVLQKEDSHLLGEKLWFRNPCTCNLNEDVCHICYGTAALEVGTLIGGNIYTTELMTSRVGQNILSAKHLLKTDAEPINFTPGWEKYFDLESSVLIPKDETRFDIFIPDNFQDDIIDKDNPRLTIYVTKDMIPITITNYQNIYIPDDVFDNTTEVEVNEVKYHKINSSRLLKLDLGIADIIPVNIMMTAKYMDIMKLFESRISGFTDISEAMTSFVNLIHGIIPILAVHAGVIIGRLMRRVDNKILRPDWRNVDEPFQFLNVKTAGYNIESVTTALSFEKTEDHLKYGIFDKRNAINRVGPKSFTDILFGYEMM